MIRPVQGLSLGPVFLAVAALVAASASMGLAVGESGRSTPPATKTTSVRSPGKATAESDAPRYVRVAGPVTTLAPAGDPSGKDIGSSRAFCPARMRVVSGGYQTMTGGGETFFSDALTSSRTGWAVGAANKLATSGTVQAFAYCARSGKAADRGNVARQRAAAKRRMKALSDRYRSLRASQF
jgi:hypothetical protein